MDKKVTTRPDTVPMFAAAELSSDVPEEGLRAGAELVVVDHLDAPGVPPGYAVEVGPWDEHGAPSRVAHVPRAAVRPREPRWERPCEEMYDWLADNDPPRLLGLVTAGSLDASDLTFAAETAGRSCAEDVVDPLLALLSRPEAVVREGAVLGLRFWMRLVRVSERMREVARSDADEQVRGVARDVLDLDDGP